MEVIDTEPFGPALMLDNVLNSAEKDEYIYHESLVQVRLLPTTTIPACVCAGHPAVLHACGSGARLV